jgi:hypothetical protein
MLATARQGSANRYEAVLRVQGYMLMVFKSRLLRKHRRAVPPFARDATQATRVGTTSVGVVMLQPPVVTFITLDAALSVLVLWCL